MRLIVGDKLSLRAKELREGLHETRPVIPVLSVAAPRTVAADFDAVRTFEGANHFEKVALLLGVGEVDDHGCFHAAACLRNPPL